MINVKLNNGTAIPILGFGVFRVEEGAQCLDAVKYALEVGYRHIDTASIYGNEKSVGQAIKESGVPREEIFLTTKLHNKAQFYGGMAENFQQSLDDLGVDYVDLYLIHWPLRPKKYPDAWLELEKIYASGRAKAIGVSNFKEHHLQDVLDIGTVVPALNQVELQPEFSQKPLIKFCANLGIAMQSYSPLGGKLNAERILQNPTLLQIGEKYGKTSAQAILRWNIQQGIVTIPKSINPERIKANFEIFDFELTADDMAAIDAINIDQRVGTDPDLFEFKG